METAEGWTLMVIRPEKAISAIRKTLDNITRFELGKENSLLVFAFIKPPYLKIITSH